jgi:hypothetical protein
MTLENIMNTLALIFIHVVGITGVGLAIMLLPLALPIFLFLITGAILFGVARLIFG